MTGRRHARLIAPALLVAGLAACAAPPGARVQAPGGAADSPPAAAEAAPETAGTPTPGAAPKAAAKAAEEVAALPLPDAAAIARAPDPMTFTGKSHAAVLQALGPATLTRREPPAQVWQYRGRTCVLDVVLYPAEDQAPAAGPLMVAHVDLRPMADGAAVSPKACAADIVQMRPAS